MRCGACMAVCPVYEVVRQEGACARGKLVLLAERRAGRLADDRRTRALLTACLLCGRCRDACPNDVDVSALVQVARVETTRRKPWMRFLLNWVLPARRIMAALLRWARWLRPLWAQRLPGDSGLRLRLSDRRLPALAEVPYLARELPAATGSGPTVALFVGCAADFLRPSSAEAVRLVLERLGARVSVPPGQGCCGLAAWGAGETTGARRVARRSLDALAPPGEPLPDFVTSPCASCAYTLRFHWAELQDDPEAAERARRLAERVVPFSILWSRLAGVKAEGPARSRTGAAVRLTYHDPCHLSRGFGEKNAPRFLLTGLAGVEYVDSEHPCRCCGHGGSFSLSQRDLSLELGADKARRLRATGAGVVVTECSGCWMQLEEVLRREPGPPMEVLTTAEALLRYGEPDSEQPTGRRD